MVDLFHTIVWSQYRSIFGDPCNSSVVGVVQSPDQGEKQIISSTRQGCRGWWTGDTTIKTKLPFW
jgi:hypothetical protein